MEIRSASHSDYNDIIGLLQQLNPDDAELDGIKGAEIFDSIMDNADLTLVVAEINNKIVSTCYLNVIPNLTRSGKPYALIENVVTDVAHRGQGIGTQVLEEAVREAFSRGCYKVMLLSGRDAGVHTFYEQCGFDKQLKTAFIRKS